MVTKKVIYNNKPLIWPIPNECKWGGGFIQLGKRVTISADKSFKEEALLFLSQLEEEGINAAIVQSGGLIQLSADLNSMNEEGYSLEVFDNSILIKAGSGKGAFYGLQSLIQLIANSEGGKIPLVSISDAPFKPVRGMHMYVPPRDKIGWFKKFIDFLAKYRYNTIFLEVGAAIKFDSHPEINAAYEGFCREMLAFPGGPDGYGMQMSIGNFKDSVHIENGGGSFLEKQEVAELVAYIRKRHINIIPEVQGFSHNYWMLMAHRDCAERDDDPYPDTWCPSNPKAYEIYFDCLQEIIDLVQPEMIHIGHDEIYTIAMCGKCRNKTGHDILAENVMKIHDWLAARNIRTAIWGDKLFGYIVNSENGAPNGGFERLNFNRRTKRNELMKATFRSADMLPNDIMIIDWYHTLGGEDSGSQDYFARRGFEEIFGNFDDIRSRVSGMPNMEDRIRRPNVLGAECSLWQETSDLGLAMKDALVSLLDAANILWYENYRLKMRYEWNRIISQVYPLERDRMKGSPSCALNSSGFEYIDLSGVYNAPLNVTRKYRLVTDSDPVPNSIPFNIVSSGCGAGPSCILAGGGTPDKIDNIRVGDCFRSVAFLHSYSENLGGIALHACTYIGPEEDIVGRYVIRYSDGTTVEVPIEYSRNITFVEYEFGAYWANPAYQTAEVREEVEERLAAKFLKTRAEPRVVFSFEWRNPRLEVVIDTISIIHDRSKKGGIVLIGITGVR